METYHASVPFLQKQPLRTVFTYVARRIENFNVLQDNFSFFVGLLRKIRVIISSVLSE